MRSSKPKQSRPHASFTAAPGRWWMNLAVPALPVLACFLGGATQKWGEGIVVALLGLILLVHPPKLSLGPWLNLVMLALLACAATAFLPANWFSLPAWRAARMNPSHAGHFQLLALHRFREAVSSVDTIPVPRKPFCFFDDDRLKQRRRRIPVDQTTGFDHGRHCP